MRDLFLQEISPYPVAFLDYRRRSSIMVKEKGIIILTGKAVKVKGPITIEDAPKTPEPAPRLRIKPV